ncbi:MAG: hypothetical protein KF773_14430 [Deltaproteobacteria bacterium]|nr:hypothetical protein [Deltaproteobacteria bacterium]
MRRALAVVVWLAGCAPAAPRPVANVEAGNDAVYGDLARAAFAAIARRDVAGLVALHAPAPVVERALRCPRETTARAAASSVDLGQWSLAHAAIARTREWQLDLVAVRTRALRGRVRVVNADACRYAPEVRGVVVTATIRATDASETFDAVAVLPLVQYEGVWYLAAAPRTFEERRLIGPRYVDKLERLAAAACACRDATCTRRVAAELDDWLDSDEVQGAIDELGGAERRRADELVRRARTCP